VPEVHGRVAMKCTSGLQWPCLHARSDGCCLIHLHASLALFHASTCICCAGDCGCKTRHVAFLEYMQAQDEETQGQPLSQHLHLRLPCITPRRHPEKQKEPNTRRKTREGGMRVEMVPGDMTKYRGVNVACGVMTTSVPALHQVHQEVLDAYGLSPRYEPGCHACEDSGGRQQLGDRRSGNEDGVAKVWRLAPVCGNGRSRGSQSPRVVLEGVLPAVMLKSMWSLAKEVLAADGVRHDPDNRPFFVDKFSRARVYMRQHLDEQHDSSLYDTKRTAPSPRRTAAAIPLRPHPQTEAQVDVGGGRKAVEASEVELHQHLWLLQQSLSRQHVSLDTRLAHLMTLKTKGLGQATQMAVDHGLALQSHVATQMVRVDHEIATLGARLMHSSQALALADISWRPSLLHPSLPLQTQAKACSRGRLSRGRLQTQAPSVLVGPTKSAFTCGQGARDVASRSLPPITLDTLPIGVGHEELRETHGDTANAHHDKLHDNLPPYAHSTALLLQVDSALLLQVDRQVVWVEEELSDSKILRFTDSTTLSPQLLRTTSQHTQERLSPQDTSRQDTSPQHTSPQHTSATTKLPHLARPPAYQYLSGNTPEESRGACIWRQMRTASQDLRAAKRPLVSDAKPSSPEAKRIPNADTPTLESVNQCVSGARASPFGGDFSSLGDTLSKLRHARQALSPDVPFGLFSCR